MKKYFIGRAGAAGLIALMFTASSSASAQGDDGSHYIPHDPRPLQLTSGHRLHSGKHRTAGKNSHSRAVASSRTAVLICPVTGDKIASVKDAVGQSTYQGKTYYFCCAGCKPRFDKDPASFVKNAQAGKFEKM
jgi:YHS domain-containing protein